MGSTRLRRILSTRALTTAEVPEMGMVSALLATVVIPGLVGVVTVMCIMIGRCRLSFFVLSSAVSAEKVRRKNETPEKFEKFEKRNGLGRVNRIHLTAALHRQSATSFCAKSNNTNSPSRAFRSPLAINLVVHLVRSS